MVLVGLQLQGPPPNCRNLRGPCPRCQLLLFWRYFATRLVHCSEIFRHGCITETMLVFFIHRAPHNNLLRVLFCGMKMRWAQKGNLNGVLLPRKHVDRDGKWENEAPLTGPHTYSTVILVKWDGSPGDYEPEWWWGRLLFDVISLQKVMRDNTKEVSFEVHACLMWAFAGISELLCARQAWLGFKCRSTNSATPSIASWNWRCLLRVYWRCVRFLGSEV
jgi:hypothetical protein